MLRIETQNRGRFCSKIFNLLARSGGKRAAFEYGPTLKKVLIIIEVCAFAAAATTTPEGIPRRWFVVVFAAF